MNKKLLVEVARIGGNVVKIGCAIVGALVVGECASIGTEKAQDDIELAGEVYKYHKNPDVYKVKEKTGKMPWSSKSYSVKINPLSGDYVPYSGNKEPVNKKAFRI